MKEIKKELNTIESLEQLESKLIKLKGNLKSLKDKAKDLTQSK